MFERFTERTCKVVAGTESGHLPHGFTGTKDLAGLVLDKEGLAAQALAAVGGSVSATCPR